MVLFRRPVEQAVFSLPELGEPMRCLPISLLASPNQLVAFIRHVGCPFAERDIRALRCWAVANPDTSVYLVSHGGEVATMHWLNSIDGIEGLKLIIDESRELYGAWGLGYSNAWHFLGRKSLSGIVRLWFSGIRNRSASGTRWQRAGVFFIKDGIVVWRYIPVTADEFLVPLSTMESLTS